MVVKIVLMQVHYKFPFSKCIVHYTFPEISCGYYLAIHCVSQSNIHPAKLTASQYLNSSLVSIFIKPKKEAKVDLKSQFTILVHQLNWKNHFITTTDGSFRKHLAPSLPRKTDIESEISSKTKVTVK